jgi:hypothetical protein
MSPIETGDQIIFCFVDGRERIFPRFGCVLEYLALVLLMKFKIMGGVVASDSWG